MVKIYLTIILKLDHFYYEKEFVDELTVKIFYYSNLKMIDHYYKTIDDINHKLFTIVFEKEIEDNLDDTRRILVVKTFDPLFKFTKNIRSLGSCVSIENRKKVDYISRTFRVDKEPVYWSSCFEDDYIEMEDKSDLKQINKIDRERRIFRKKKNEKQLCISIRFNKEINNKYKEFLKKYSRFKKNIFDDDYYEFKHTFC